METHTKEVTKKVEKLSIKLVVMLLVLAVVLALLFLITKNIVIKGEQNFDDKMFSLLDFASMPQLRNTMLFFTFFGSSNFLLPAYIFISAFYFFKKQDRSRSLNVATVGLSSAALLYLLKNVFRRIRPGEQLLKNIAGYSYPSGHAFSSFTFCGLLIYITWQLPVHKAIKWCCSVLLFLFAAMVALSRVYFHVHYPSDVIAGFLLSIVWLTVCYAVLIKWKISERLVGG